MGPVANGSRRGYSILNNGRSAASAMVSKIDARLPTLIFTRASAQRTSDNQPLFHAIWSISPASVIVL